MTNRPADVAGYVRQFVDVWRPANASNVTPNPAPASPPAVAPPSPMPGGTPPAAPVVTNDTPVLAILRSDPSQVDRLAADLGPAKFADRVLAFYDGTVIADQTPREVLANPKVQMFISGTKPGEGAHHA